jgi:hypothetical protein
MGHSKKLKARLVETWTPAKSVAAPATLGVVWFAYDVHNHPVQRCKQLGCYP